ncbi:MAG: DUF1801 domain-containing protein [Verrucomicrobiales bacterium]|nr:DUF1801 domain-containing protein [Verrucomicrobiales bacterium]
MKTKPAPKTETIDQYILGFPPDIQTLLNKVRAAIHKAVPQAEETISYRIPAFRFAEGTIVYFAAFKQHIGLYPTSSGMRQFEKELSSYETSKGAVRFPFDRPIPYTLVRRIAKFRAQEVRAKARMIRS